MTPLLFRFATRLVSGLFLGSIVFLTPQMMAQSEPDPASKSEEEATVLAPFIVVTEKDVGYLAQNTASGSRLNANLQDTPAPISVFTAEFLQDIGATDLSSLSDYVVNTERIPGFQNGLASGANQVEFDTQFRIRGLPATSNTGRSVNFFKFPIEIDSYNIDRIEFARGPNSILFGVAAAAGNFNVSTKKANVQRDAYELTARTDSWDQARVSTDINQVLVKGKWALRVNALTNRENSWREYEHNDADRLALATKWRVATGTVVDLEYETGKVDSARMVPWSGVDRTTSWMAAGSQIRGFPPAPPTSSEVELLRTNYWVYNTDTGEFYNWRNSTTSGASHRPDLGLPFVAPTEQILLSDFSIVPKEVSIAGPGYGNNIDYNTFTATVQHRFTENLFVELAYNRVADSYLSNALTPVDIAIFWDTNAKLPNGQPNPNVGKPYVEGTNGIRLRDEYADDLRLTAAYDLDLGKIFGRHHLAGLLEHRLEETTRIATTEIIADPGAALRADPNNRANNIKRRTYVDLNGPASGIAIPDWRDVSLDGVTNLSGGGTLSTVYYPQQNGVYDYRSEFDSMMLATQSFFWEDRIAVTLGYREDRAKFYNSTAERIGTPLGAYTVGTWEAVRAATPDVHNAITRSQGIVFHPVKSVSMFYNHASNFALPNPQIIMFPGDSSPPPAKGESDDMGLKFSLFGGRVYATLTYYKTSAIDDADFGLVTGNGDINAIWDTFSLNGVLPDVLADLGFDTSLTASDLHVNAGGNTFDSNSEGYEVEIIANPTRNLRLSFNFSDNKTVRTNIGKEIVNYLALRESAWLSGNRGGYVINAVGAPVAPNDPTDGITTVYERLQTAYSGIADVLVKPEGARYLGSPTQSANLRANYTFSDGIVKGVSIGGGVRWRGESVIGYTSSDPATRQIIYGDPYTLVDMNIGYRRKIKLFGDVREWSIQLNVNNLFNNDDIIPTETFASGQLRQYIFQTPRRVMLTTTMKF